MNLLLRTLIATLSVLLSLSQAVQAAPECSVNGELAKRFNLPIYEWRDPEQIQRATIVAVHGLTFYAAAYDDLASFLAEKGYRFVAMDMRGFGRWRDEHKRFGGDNLIHFTQSSADLEKLVASLKQEQPEQKLFAMGESLGANLALDLVAKRPELCDGVILGSLCYKPHIHPKPRWAIDIAKGLHHPNKRLDLTPYITPYLSHDRSLTNNCLNDKKIFRSLSPVELIKAKKTNEWALLNVGNLPKSFPVLVIAGAKDGVYKTRLLPELLKQFGSQDIDVNIFPDKGHLLLEHQSVMPEIGSIFERWLTDRTRAETVVQLP